VRYLCIGACPNDRATPALAIDEEPAKADLSNTTWQHQLSATQGYVGNVHLRQGDLTAALERYTASLSIRERLAKADPSNADWQYILAFSQVSIGAVLAKQGNLLAALAHYKAALAIRDRLAKAEPSNTSSQQTLAESHNLVGDVLLEQGNLTAALRARSHAGARSNPTRHQSGSRVVISQPDARSYGPLPSPLAWSGHVRQSTDVRQGPQLFWETAAPTNRRGSTVFGSSVS
jgi:tetratricopeptide (TPR) repeat protein